MKVARFPRTAMRAAAGLAVVLGFGVGVGVPIAQASDATAESSPTLEFTVDPVGTVSTRTGIATISGTYTCTGGTFFTLLEVSQTVGRVARISGYNSDSSETCDGAPKSWSFEVVPYNGKFAGGKASVIVYASVCDSFYICAVETPQVSVQLRGGK